MADASELNLFGAVTGRSRAPERPLSPAPLIVAVHGGTYSSAYFDVPGHSLLDRAAANGVAAIALDRPGYGGTRLIDGRGASIEEQARFLVEALGDRWTRYGEEARGIVLIGHSIGGAIALAMASAPGELPVIGVAVSGVGLRTPEGHHEGWAGLPDQEIVDIPTPMKDQLMFAGGFPETMPAASHVANTGAPKAELLDITGPWTENVARILGRIAVPVHYRQAEHDALWVVDQGQVDGFRAACVAATWVHAALVRGAGHCIDFHHAGAALQLQQIGFALQCACEAGR